MSNKIYCVQLKPIYPNTTPINLTDAEVLEYLKQIKNAIEGDTLDGYMDVDFATIDQLRQLIQSIDGMLIKQPSITSPTDGSTNVTSNLITCTSIVKNTDMLYNTTNSTDWMLAKDSNFTTGLVVNMNDTIEVTEWLAELEDNTTYYVKCRHTVGRIHSPWSQIVSFTTGVISYIKKPYVRVVGKRLKQPSNPIIRSGRYKAYGELSTSTHTSTDYLITDKHNNVLLSNYEDTVHLRRFETPVGTLPNELTRYYIRVRYRDELGHTSPYKRIVVKTKQFSPPKLTSHPVLDNVYPNFSVVVFDKNTYPDISSDIMIIGGGTSSYKDVLLNATLPNNVNQRYTYNLTTQTWSINDNGKIEPNDTSTYRYNIHYTGMTSFNIVGDQGLVKPILYGGLYNNFNNTRTYNNRSFYHLVKTPLNTYRWEQMLSGNYHYGNFMPLYAKGVGVDSDIHYFGFGSYNARIAYGSIYLLKLVNNKFKYAYSQYTPYPIRYYDFRYANNRNIYQYGTPSSGVITDDYYLYYIVSMHPNTNKRYFSDYDHNNLYKFDLYQTSYRFNPPPETITCPEIANDAQLTKLPNNLLWVLFPRTGNIYLFNTTTQQWTLDVSLNKTLSYCRIATLTNGNIFIAGIEEGTQRLFCFTYNIL